MSHDFAGRIAEVTAMLADPASTTAGHPAMVTFCRCGLGFYGKDATEADQRFRVHQSDARRAETEQNHA